MKVAVITPYCEEPLSIIRRCHESVQSQTHECRHFLIADGHARDEIDGWEATHMRLPLSHADNGNTPRGLGSILAANEGFEAFAYLDADNWYAPTHITSLLDCVNMTGCEVAFSGRQIVLPSGQMCPFEDEDVLNRRAVDTSCYFITSRASHLLSIWCMMDQVLSPICDRVMFAAIRTRGVTAAWTDETTVYYETRWGSHFKLLGLPPPADEHVTDWDRIEASFSSSVLKSRLGFDPFEGVHPNRRCLDVKRVRASSTGCMHEDESSS